MERLFKIMPGATQHIIACAMTPQEQALWFRSSRLPSLQGFRCGRQVSWVMVGAPVVLSVAGAFSLSECCSQTPRLWLCPPHCRTLVRRGRVVTNPGTVAVCHMSHEVLEQPYLYMENALDFSLDSRP